MIIILGGRNDEHCIHVANHLDKLKEEYCFLDTRNYPIFNWEATSQNCGSIITEGKRILFGDIKSVYWRNYYSVPFEKISDDEFVSKMVQREKESALSSLFYSLKTNWVNSIKAFELHKKKAYLINLMKENNIRVPNTLITDDKDRIEDFFDKNNNKIIVKPILGGAYTEKLSKNDLTKERLDSLITSPVQFQELIDGVDIRVYAFKDEIYAIRIEADTIDFREDLNAKLIKTELPKNICEDCKKVMQISALKYSGIDIRLSNQGEYVFIEANPAPMFIYAEKQTKYPLTQSLINLLTS